MIGEQHTQQPHDFLDFITDDIEVGTSKRQNVYRGSGRSRGGY